MTRTRTIGITGREHLPLKRPPQEGKPPPERQERRGAKKRTSLQKCAGKIPLPARTGKLFLYM
ncbi:MAG: hypothetical protein KGI33_12010 [Thaumarchaeota archaeon]|nr:hypothetical protein [Nitrososphaerota archaeon]